jgi:predicted transposase YbfD/YdcC
VEPSPTSSQAATTPSSPSKATSPSCTPPSKRSSTTKSKATSRTSDTARARRSTRGHGRTDERAYFPAKVHRDLAPADDWPEVKAAGDALRLTTNADGRETSDVCYYIATRYLSGKCFAEAVQGHWPIEPMHWVLDVTFRKDDSRTRERTLGNNLRWLRRFAVTLLKRHPAKDSIRRKMLNCGYSTAVLEEVLEIQSS